MLRIAIDIGGTFTDVVAQTRDGLSSIKVLTRPGEPELSALEGVDRVLARLEKQVSDITGIVHGTTLATNALIERRGAKLAFVTTAGFRDVLEMRYEKRFDQYALDIELPEPLVPRPLRFGLTERILADGSVLIPPSDSEIGDIVDHLEQQQVEAVAVGFLHAYKNPSHERYVAQRLQQSLPSHITICQSADVAGEIREYERFSTVCANAYVRPLMARYLEKLQTTLVDKGFAGSILMVLSDGALTTLEKATRYPIRLLEGGPAGGVSLGAHVAREVGSDKTLALDIGGTTAKICFIEKGVPKTSRRFEIARTWRGVKGSGLPIRVPTVELVEIGAGGGSVAQVDCLHRLGVGPRSASAVPGPAAYNQGGDEATITDAHITVGHLAPEGFAEGIIELKPKLAAVAIARDVQKPLDFERVEQAAAGIIELADEFMANAARVHGIELGLDVSSFDLLVSGGGGGLHAARIAEKLGIQRVIVPAMAGVGSAVGFLHTPIAFENAISVVEPLDKIDLGALIARVQARLAEVRAIVNSAITDGPVETGIAAEIRYQGQGLSLTSTMAAHENLTEAFATVADDFRMQYQKLHGYTLDDIPIELVSVSVSAKESRGTCTSGVAHQPSESNQISDAPTTRNIFDADTDQDRAYRVLARECIPDTEELGPAVVPEAQTTTVVRPGWSIRTLSGGHLQMHRGNT